MNTFYKKLLVMFTTGMFTLNFFVYDHYLTEAWNKVSDYQEQVFALEDPELLLQMAELL